MLRRRVIVAFLLDDEHGQSLLLVQTADGREELADDRRGETERRLIEHEQPRSRDQRSAKCETCCSPPLSVAAG